MSDKKHYEKVETSEAGVDEALEDTDGFNVVPNDGEFEANAFGLPIKHHSDNTTENHAQIELSDMNLAIPYNDIQQRGLIPERAPESKPTDPKPKTRKKKKVKKPKSRIIRYPTQCMSIGAIRCLFLSCYDRGQSPFLTLGPSWPFTCFLLCFAGMILAYFLVMINMANNPNPTHLTICYFGLGINLLILFAGILGNPGIPKQVTKRLLKERLGKS